MFANSLMEMLHALWIKADSSLLQLGCCLRYAVRWEGRGRKWWRCWWRASSCKWWALLWFSSSGTPSPNGVTATTLHTLCCYSHSHQVIAWVHALTYFILPYSIVESSIFKSYRCSQEEFYSFRTLCKKKEFQVNERQSSTEKMGFLYLFHPGFKIDDVEFWRFLNILQICFWMRDRQKVIAEISQLFCMFYVVAAVFHAILKISLGC
jgi:hypothetical protein